MQRYDEPFLPFGKALIDTTKDLVAGYVFDLEAYLVPGAAGMIALERTIGYVPSDLVTILHGGFLTAAMTSGMSMTMNSDSITVAQPALIDAQPLELRSRLLLSDKCLAGQDATPYSSFLTENGVITVRGADGQSIHLNIAGPEVTQAGTEEDFAGLVRKMFKGKHETGRD